LEWRKAAELGLCSAELLQSLDEQIEKAIDTGAERLRATMSELTDRHGVQAECGRLRVSNIAQTCAGQGSICFWMSVDQDVS
jgi:bacterioferritin-associated ferredoxin